MKTLLKSTAVLSALLITVSATAADRPSQGALLTQCKNLINEQFDDVQRIKLANMKQRRGSFIAKFSVVTDDQRARYTCTVDRAGDTQLVRTDKPVEQVAGS